MENKAGTASPKKAGVSIAETAAAARAARGQLAPLGIKEEKAAPAHHQGGVSYTRPNPLRNS